MKETPSFNRRGRFLAMKRASLHIEETPSLFANSSIYSPLHSERGGGEAPSFPLREAGRGGRRKASVPTMVPTAIFDVYVFL
ncbi:hypothetical protein HMPREF0973_00390 [Prevotella veroralis F0319]|uniref:Uncharacterized protein n=1 Tax=Prevotella veroralis F0319 TaxID=649761 RepID=C9MLB5_9BACT|nr:hypothetical protein HMPREF0973_00390 [Prevotella veroralis F0319]